MRNTMDYITFRKKYSLLISLIQYIFIIISLFLMLIWKPIILCSMLIIVFYSVMEFVFVKCPHCNKRPGRLWRQFPKKCRHCGKAL